MSTSNWSEPAEQLLHEKRECDVLVIGSGYGGSVAAATLANGSRSVWVLERGREYRLGEFPEDVGQLPGHVRLQRAGREGAIGRADALFDVRSFDGGAVLLGSGLGGGSLINAGVMLRPDHALFRRQGWPAAIQGLTDAQIDALYDDVERMLGAEVFPGAEQLPKFQALARLARSMGERAEPVPLAVAGRDVPADATQPVDLKACIKCGNCITGCNHGAKRTLVTNLIPAAVARKARFFTGAEATGIEPLQAPGRMRYRVHFRLVADRAPVVYSVDAHTVVVAAGALGSTELLLRSREEQRLVPSARLGKRFSANGDTITMGWAQRRPVQAFAGRDATGARAEPGPTITGAIRTQVGTGEGHLRRAYIEDGAAPEALARGGVVLGSTLSLFHRYLGRALPGFYRDRRDKDWVAMPQALADHAQLLLAMGEDESNGTLGWDAKAQRVEVKDWPRQGPQPGDNEVPGMQEALHEWFGDAHDRRGFDGGDYLPNPLWRALPDGFAEVAGAGAQAGGRITVHPLGGCGMGDDAASGVVDHFGTVFRADGGRYEGLHVLDGAMLPAATGPNPFPTIAALALRAARHIDKQLGGQPAAPQRVPQQQPWQAKPLVWSTDGGVELKFCETLHGRPGPAAPPAWLQALLQAYGVPAGQLRSWIAEVRVAIPLDAWLADPSLQLKASLRLWAHPEPVGLEVDASVFDRAPLLEGEGTVVLLGLDRAQGITLAERALEAMRCFSERRPGETDFWGAVQNPAAALATLMNHALHRELRYAFTLGVPKGPALYRLEGTKKLAYARGAKTLWDALVQLPLVLAHGQEACTLDLEVDLVDMLRKRRLQVEHAPNTPAAIVGLAAFGAQWARALVQTHFWSFRGLTYQELAPQVVPPPPAQLEGALCETVTVMVPVREGSKERIAIELHRYRKPGPPKGCVLVIHGLAHGTGVFTTETVRTNLAQHFLRQDYTVWLLDHRLSNRLAHAGKLHTIDDVALCDVTHAIHHVHAEHGAPIRVFAHCVGAAAFAMAVLKGRFTRGDGSSMVESAILHAVHPWVEPSASNRLSAALAALYKDLLPADLKIDPVPGHEGKAMDEVIDRVAATLPWPADERVLHEQDRLERPDGYAACNRMTLFYGREWRHENLETATHERLPELVGVGGLEVFRQLFFIALRRRLTDRGGENAYLKQSQLKAHWTFHTLFAHGSDNKVFDVRSAAQSARRLLMVHDTAARVRPPAVGLFVPTGRYGHMDFLFGKHAARDVYPALTNFFDQPLAFASKVQGQPVDLRHSPPDRILVNRGTPDEQDITDTRTGMPRRPNCGPAVQVDREGGRRRLVLWVEQAVDVTSDLAVPALRIDGRLLGQEEYGHARSQPSGAGVCWLLVIPESAEIVFEQVRRIEFFLQYAGAIPMVKGGEAAGSRAVPPAPWWRKPWALASRLGLAAARPLQFTGEEAQGTTPPPLPEEGWQTLAITHLPWWQRWVVPGAGAGAPVTAFLAASCRWPGLPFEREAVNGVATPMLAHLDLADGTAAQAVVLLGDQIYVDATANVAETTEEGERGAQRYRDAWEPGTPAGDLLSRVPVWMVVDDHEFGDDVGEFTGSAEDDRLLTLGFEANRAYQWRRIEPQPSRPAGATSRQPAERGFWYAFDIGGIPAFAADTRTERRSRRDPATWAQAPIMGDEQALALEAWLLAHRHEPKVLCSGSVFGLPTRRSVEHPATRRHADDWTGYPASMERLVKCIVANDVRNLIFLSGDYHLSAMARLTLAHGGKSVDAVAIVCSGWNATLPFANAHENEFAWDRDVVVPSGTVQVTSHARMLSDAARQFGKVCIRRGNAGHQVDVDVFNEKGTRLETGSLPLA